MSQLPPAGPTSPPADSSAVSADPGLEVALHAFWTKNRGIIFVLCAVILLGIVAREGWQYFGAMREKSVQEQYASVSDKPERLAVFAEANASHPLAGVAYLQIADQKFESGQFKDAGSSYTKAAGILKNEALLGRAKLGAAVSLVSGGDVSGGESALKSIAADPSLASGARAEANYHLAVLALGAGRTDDVRKLVEEISKLDLAGPWSQRGTMLLSNLPDSAKVSDPASAFSIKPAGK